MPRNWLGRGCLAVLPWVVSRRCFMREISTAHTFFMGLWG